VIGTLSARFYAMLGFVGGHFLPSWPPLRKRLIARLGQGPFAGRCSLHGPAVQCAGQHPL